jgi:hypothetical protein
MELDLGLGGPGPAAPLEIASSRMSHLWNALCRAKGACARCLPWQGHPQP